MARRRPAARAGSTVLVIGACLLALSPNAASTAASASSSGGEDEGSDALSLRQLVDAARRAKAAELARAAARLMPEVPAVERETAIPGLPAGAGLETTRAPRDPPRLWTLHAVADRWRAEIVHEGRVRVIDSASAPTARLGPWRVTALREQGLLLTRVGGGPGPARTLLLALPARGGLASGLGMAPAMPAPAALAPPRRAVHDALSIPTAAEDDAVRRAAALPPSPGARPDLPLGPPPGLRSDPPPDAPPDPPPDAPPVAPSGPPSAPPSGLPR